MFKSIITGKVFKVGDDIDTDQIYPGRYLYLTLPDEIAPHTMEGIIPDFSKQVAEEDWIIVAGNIVAESFGRIFYRNAINIGLPILKCPDFIKKVHQSDLIKINLQDGLITLYNPERKISIEKYPPQLLSILKSGGLISYLKKYGKYSHFTDEI
jgi:3-isopropylmalate/(R)-2-methylmalate dehydratase small subunit